MSIKALQAYTFHSKVARYNPELKRRDTWTEANDRVLNMHLSRYPQITEELKWAFEQSKNRRVLGSQRALQYAGAPVLKKHARQYNCTSSYCDRVRFFQEALWLLLCGAGVGFSVQLHHVAKLPDFHECRTKGLTLDTKTYTIPDSIEGWADALGVILATYLPHEQFPEWQGVNVVFDYSEIRPKGAALSSGVGKAPGPEPLKKSLDAIRFLLERCVADGQLRLRSIDAYDIVMHASDAVLSGGVRRAATICLFSPNDSLMIKAKTGDWYYTNPQRGRSNNSVMMLRDETDELTFHQLMESVRQFGEPGFIWSDSTEMMVNPCFHPDERISTDKGQRKLIDLFNEAQPNNVAYDTRPGKDDELDRKRVGIKTTLSSPVRLTQKQADIFKIVTEHGHQLRVTANHKFPTVRGRLELKDLVVGDTLLLPSGEQPFGSEGSFEAGLILGIITGDGVVCNDLAFVDVWEKDFDVLDEIKKYIHSLLKQVSSLANGGREYEDLSWINQGEDKKRIGGLRLFRYLKENLGISNPLSIKDSVPECVWQGNRDMVAGYIQGLFFADGTLNRSYHKTKPTFSWRLNQSNEPLLVEVQQLLGMFGVVSRVTPRRSAGVRLSPDGKGGSKIFPVNSSFDLILNRPNSIEALKSIGCFGRKRDILDGYIAYCGLSCNKPERYITKVKSIEPCGVSDVYCLTQYATNVVIANGIVTGQCAEISMYPVDVETGKSGWSACNLCEINGKKCKTKEDFMIAARAAAIIGTAQAGYTDLAYLGEVSERIFRREALLGVSITGMQDSPEILFDPEIQREVAKLVVSVNTEIATKIGINPAARCTAIKPAGTTSLILGTSSGIHPHHSKRYIRHVQANALEAPFQFLKSKNPSATEKSVWSKNCSDEVISFCIEVPEGSRTKKDVTAIKLLEMVCSTQNNWIKYGKVAKRCIQPWLSHNVSNTINVKPDEWEEVEEFIYAHRKELTGVSLLSSTGDLDYPQAPFVAIHTPSEIVKMYGDGSLMASGLIVDGLTTFDNNLWLACDYAMGVNTLDDSSTEGGNSAKVDWIRRARQFADRYFEGKRKLMTYCLKEVHNWKYWCDLQREYIDVDYKELIEEEDNTKIAENIGCAGGVCELTF
jgi:intein/homing endonuclease